MTPPSTYAGWADELSRFAEGDDAALDRMEAGSLAWSGAVAERVTRRIDDALRSRLDGIHGVLRDELHEAGVDADAVALALRRAGRKLQTLHRLASLHVLPQAVQDHLRAYLDGYAEDTVRSLLDRADIADSAGRLRQAIRGSMSPDRATATPPDGGAPVRRTLIIG